MDIANRKNTLIIKAGKKSFIQEGFEVVTPYVEYGLFARILREIYFRIPLLPKKIWYNKEIKDRTLKYVLIFDPLITVDFLQWIIKLYPKTQLNFVYGNLVGRAWHLLPAEIPTQYRVWSYDKKDCEKYSLRFFHSTYCTSYVRPMQKTEYDVLFVGKDKGRAPFLLELENRIRKAGLKPYFIITKDGRFSRKKSFYKDPIPYSEVIELITKSKSILNVVLPGQVGITVRDMESLFFGVKLLTTNKGIINEDFYNPNNIFIINDLCDIDKLHEFLGTPVQDIDERIKSKRRYSYFINEITGAKDTNG